MAHQSTIQTFRGTQAQLDASTVILAQGEPGFATDTNVLKFGNGTALWKDLPAVGGTSGAQLTFKDIDNDPTSDGQLVDEGTAGAVHPTYIGDREPESPAVGEVWVHGHTVQDEVEIETATGTDSPKWVSGAPVTIENNIVLKSADGKTWGIWNSNINDFMVVEPALPEIFAIALVNTRYRLIGKRFGSDEAQVLVNDTPVDIKDWEDEFVTIENNITLNFGDSIVLVDAKSNKSNAYPYFPETPAESTPHLLLRQDEYNGLSDDDKAASEVGIIPSVIISQLVEENFVPGLYTFVEYYGYNSSSYETRFTNNTDANVIIVIRPGTPNEDFVRVDIGKDLIITYESDHIVFTGTFEDDTTKSVDIEVDDQIQIGKTLSYTSNNANSYTAIFVPQSDKITDIYLKGRKLIETTRPQILTANDVLTNPDWIILTGCELGASIKGAPRLFSSSSAGSLAEIDEGALVAFGNDFIVFDRNVSRSSVSDYYQVIRYDGAISQIFRSPEYDGLFVKLRSTDTQVIDSEIALDRGNQFLGTKADGTEHVLASAAIYVTYMYNGDQLSKTAFGVPYSEQNIIDNPALVSYVPTSKVIITTDGVYMASDGGDPWAAVTIGTITNQSEFGNTSEHTELNTNIDPVYGNHITNNTPAGKEVIAHISDLPLVTKEDLSAQIDGTNQTFTISTPLTADSQVVLWFNGVNEEHFSVSGQTLTTEFTPSVGSSLIIWTSQVTPVGPTPSAGFPTPDYETYYNISGTAFQSIPQGMGQVTTANCTVLYDGWIQFRIGDANIDDEYYIILLDNTEGSGVNIWEGGIVYKSSSVSRSYFSALFPVRKDMIITATVISTSVSSPDSWGTVRNISIKEVA